MAQINQIFQYLIDHKGSDLHLSEGSVPKIRVHGSVTPIEGASVLDHETIKMLLGEICDPAAFEKYLEGGDLDFAYTMDADSRFRCNYFRQQHGLGAVFRIIPTEIKTLIDLDVPPQVINLANVKSGLVLVTGPTGSGKSTTLAAMVDFINSSYKRHIVTVEEPIEFVHNSKQSIITQREVGIHTPTFAQGLKAAAREDADVVLVGEMRDLDTIQLALTAAEMGMLVFGTLHTNSARKTIDRIIDVFPADQQSQVRTMLAASLQGVVSQLLMKRVDKPGRCAVNEILFANPAVSAVIREGATPKLYDVIQAGRDQGMQLMDDSIWQRLQQGMVSPEEAYLKATNKDRFAPMLPETSKSLTNAAG